jgi:IS30 family transposase
MSHAHLTVAQRELLALLHLLGYRQADIAQALGKHQATICRELRRNGTETGGYRSVLAQRRYQARRQAALQQRPRRMAQPEILAQVQAGLRKFWSPAQIVGRWAHQAGRAPVSTETIYQWIWTQRAHQPQWAGQLRQARRKNRPRKLKTLDRRGKIPHRVFIDARPAVVAGNTELGHWEADTLIGQQRRGAVITHVERKRLYLVLAPLPQRDHRQLVRASRQAFARHDRQHVLPRQTLTLDNGLEFWSHRQLGKGLGVAVYFAHPHHPWERGRNEQVNGLVRQFLPKGSDLRSVTTRQLQAIEALLNNRPRKTLGYRTPSEVLMLVPDYALRI